MPMYAIDYKDCRSPGPADLPPGCTKVEFRGLEDTAQRGWRGMPNSAK